MNLGMQVGVIVAELTGDHQLLAGQSSLAFFSGAYL